MLDIAEDKAPRREAQNVKLKFANRKECKRRFGVEAGSVQKRESEKLFLPSLSFL
jgi:hypothetical protein